MKKYQLPKQIDLGKYKTDSPTEVLYGLPKEVIFCESCVISNQRPSSTIEFKNDGTEGKRTIGFDNKNICDACKVKGKKDAIDWQDRESKA